VNHDPHRLVVALHGAYHTDNFGDMLLMLITRRWLEEVSPHVEVRMPFVRAELAARLRPGSIRGPRALLGAGLFVYGGGGYFGEPPRDVARWSLRLARRHLLPGLAMTLLRRGVSICGVGAGPLTHPLARTMIRPILRRANPITVRDESSRTTLIALGADPDAVTVTADLALTLRRETLPQDAVKHARSWIAALPDGPRLGVHLSPSAATGEAGRRLVEEVVAFAQTNPDLQLVALTDQRGAEGQSFAAAQLCRRLPARAHAYAYDDPWRLSALLAELDLVITTKLHVGIVAVAVGTAVLSYPTHPKTPRFYRQIGAEDACHPLGSLRPGMVTEHLERRFGVPEGFLAVPDGVRAAAQRNRDSLQRTVAEHLRSHG